MTRLRKMYFGAALGAMFGLGTAMAGDDVSAAWHAQQGLVGTWQFEMTVRFHAPDCSTGAVVPFGPNPFPGLISYHAGGTLSEFGSRAPSSVRSNGFGSWKRTGKGQYKARDTFMEFDANGLLWRTMVIDMNINLDKSGNKYQAVNRLQMTDVSGNALNFCATVDAVRFEP